MSIANRCAALFLVMAWVLSASAQPDPLFQSAALLDITFEAPFAQIDRERDKEAKYDGIMRYVNADGLEVHFDIRLEVRGNWRLQKSNCRYSQLWIDLKRGQTPNTLFSEQNRLKLVVQCRGQDRYRDYLAKEQQLYETFANLSDIHFGTRLVNATYIDSEDPSSSRTHLAFFIEHQRRLRDRFEMEEVELNRISYSDLDPVQSSLVGLFMYQIGNTDFSMVQAAEGDECCHNTKLLVDKTGRYFPIPYDFDSSGFVNASYAAPPNPTFGIRNNRSRKYRGFCFESEQLNAAVARITAERDNTITIISDTSHVSERTANRSLRYMEEFYEDLNDQRRYQREIIENCRGDIVR
ncbi:MAG: hypothetical protein JKY86_01590 [Gammaproteobacteria bacterium]|nr:hypothetical protein [Gammaproteobacteria bacterium]